MSNDFPFKLLLCLELMERIFFPETTGLEGDGGGDDFDFFFAVACGSTSMMTRTDGDACLGEVSDTHGGGGGDDDDRNVVVVVVRD